MPPDPCRVVPVVAHRVRVTDSKRGVDWWAAVGGREHRAAPFWTPFVRAAWCIVVDIDHPDADLRAWSLPAGAAPSWVVHTTRGRAQAGWIIDTVALGPTAHEAPQRYLSAVTEALRAELDGDPQFTGQRCRNPWWDGASTRWGPTEPRTLGALKTALAEAGRWQTRPPHPHSRTDETPPASVLWTGGHHSRPGGRDTPEAAWPAVIPAGARNSTVFELARRHSDPETAVYRLAERCVPPLPPREVATLARQAVRYARTGAGGGRVPEHERQGPAWEAYRAAQADRGRRGGSRDTAAQREARTRGPAAAAVVRSAEATMRAEALRIASDELIAQGATVAAAAAALGVSLSTLKRARRGGVSEGVSTGANTGDGGPKRPPQGRQGLPRPLPETGPEGSAKARPGDDRMQDGPLETSRPPVSPPPRRPVSGVPAGQVGGSVPVSGGMLEAGQAQGDETDQEGSDDGVGVREGIDSETGPSGADSRAAGRGRADRQDHPGHGIGGVRGASGAGPAAEQAGRGG